MTPLGNFLQTIAPFSIFLQMLFNRVLFAALALSALTAAISNARNRLSLVMRSWLWASCIPTLILPIEGGAVALAQRLGALYWIQAIFEGGVWGCLSPVLSFIWLAGFIFFAIKTIAERTATLRLLKSGGINSCAAYFSAFRPHIYLPPDFEREYTPLEQKMLLDHEMQHVKQHDPLLYSALQWIQCVFWFCPAISSAVCLIRRDRELLCDERAAQGYSRREYGLLLLREAGKAPPKGALAGITADSGGMYERIKACAEPNNPGGGRAAVVIVCLAACIVAFGLINVISPVIRTPMSIAVFEGSASDITYIEGAERFVSLTANGADVDEKGLYEFVKAAGLDDDTILHITVALSVRPMLFTSYFVREGFGSKVGALMDREIFIPKTGYWDFLKGGL